MTLAYLGTTVYTGASTLSGGMTWEAGNQAFTIDRGAGKLRKYDLNTLAEVGSGTTIATGAYSMCMINSASGIISLSSTNVGLYELASGYYTTYSGGTSNQANVRGIAADKTSGIAIYIGTSNVTLGKFVASTFTHSTMNFRINSGSNAINQCITCKGDGTNRWFVGNQIGEIFEIDETAKVVSMMQLTYDNTSGIGGDGNGSSTFLYITNMVYDNNLLLVSASDGNIYLVDWSSKTILNRQQSSSGGTGFAVILSNSASGECFAQLNGTTASTPGGTLQEIDFTIKPITIKDHLYFADSGSNQVSDIGINTLNNRGWYSRGSNMYFFTVSNVRVTTTQTITVNPGGVHQKARVWLLDDTGGAGTISRPMLDTVVQSPATYRVLPGRTIKQLSKVGDGEDAVFGYSEYST